MISSTRGPRETSAIKRHKAPLTAVNRFPSGPLHSAIDKAATCGRQEAYDWRVFGFRIFLFFIARWVFLFARANGSATDGTACIISKKEQTVVPCSPPRLRLCTNTFLISFTVIYFNGSSGGGGGGCVFVLVHQDANSKQDVENTNKRK